MTDVKNYLIQPTAAIVDAMRLLDRSSGRVALVVDENSVLLGTISDGDVRRGFLRGLSLDTPLLTIMNRHPVSVHPDAPSDEVLAKMRRHVLRDIPVVDEQGRVLALRTLEQLTQRPKRDNPVVIMAGGVGARLRPLTERCPKPMLKLGGRPLLETTLERLFSLGFRNITLAVNYMAEVIMNHFGDGSAMGLNITYLREESALGTAGALSLLPKDSDLPIVVMNGDILTMADIPAMIDFHEEHSACGTMAAREFETQVPYGVVIADGVNISEIREKPAHRYLVNAGLYVVAPHMRDLVPRGARMDMPDLFMAANAQGEKTVVHVLREYWIDIGHIADYERANAQYTQIFGDSK